MGLLQRITDAFTSSSQGENWADKVWEHNMAVEAGEKDGEFIDPNTVIVSVDEDGDEIAGTEATLYEEIGVEYASSPGAFSSGFASRWNEHVEEEEEPTSLLGRFWRAVT